MVKEIDKGSLEASDFTVVLSQRPYLDQYDALAGIYWSWAENILEEEPYDFKDPVTNIYDDNQNTVVSVDFGLGNYGYLHIYQQMGQLWLEKKRLTALKEKIEDENKREKL